MVHQLSKTMMLSLSMLFFASTAHQAASVPDVVPKCSSNSADQSDAADLLDESLCLLQAESKIVRQKILDSKEEPTKIDSDKLSFLQEADLAKHLMALRKSNAASLLSTVRTLATAAANGKFEATPITQQALQFIVTAMEDNVINVSHINHEEDQREVDRSHATIVKCTTTMQSAFTAPQTGVDAIQAQMVADNNTHDACRVQQKSKNSTKQTECGDFEDYANSLVTPSCLCPSLPAGPSPSLLTCIQNTETWATTANTTYVTHEDECTEATTQLTNQKATCDANQRTFESAFCGYGQSLTTTCSAYTSCRKTSIGIFSTTISDVKVSEAARKAEYKAAKKVICYVGVFSAAAADKPAALDTCNTAVYSTADFDVLYPTAPDAATCDISPVASKPCDSTFVSTYYDGKTWSTLAPAIACVACGYDATPAPAPPAPPAPAPTPYPTMEYIAPTPYPTVAGGPGPTPPMPDYLPDY